MLGLCQDEMFFGDIDFIISRLDGWLSLERFRQNEDWKRSRLVAFTIAKSMGSTKAKTEKDFMKIGEDNQPTQLSEEQIKKLKEL